MQRSFADARGHFPMQKIDYYAIFLQINALTFLSYHFYPPFVPKIYSGHKFLPVPILLYS